MEESGVFFVLKVFVGLKRIIEEIFLLCLQQYHQFKSVYVTKHRFIKEIIFWDFIDGRWNCFPIICIHIYLFSGGWGTGKPAENSLLWSIAFLPVENFSLSPLCLFLIFKFLAFRFFSQGKVLYYSKNLL